MSGILLEWERGDPLESREVIRLRSYYEFLAQRLFAEYEPTKRSTTHPRRDFLARLEKWLASFEDKSHAMIAFKSIQYLFFAGVSEFEELYRCAYEQHIARWAMAQAEIGLFDDNVEKKLSAAISNTWICPATDSLRINGFLHINGLKGHDLRTDWRALSEVGDGKRIAKYVARKKIQRLVIVDDFVGAGDQFWSALSYAIDVFSGQILAVPLICCAEGERKIKESLAEAKVTRVTVSPVLVVPDNCMVGRDSLDGEPKLFAKLRQAMLHGYTRMAINTPGAEFGKGELGSLTILYSNCPNNTPPIYGLDAGGRWSPIFRRISR